MVFAVAGVHPPVGPSVPPSITLVHCIHTTEDVVKLLSWLVAPSLLFWPVRWYPISRETPSAGAQKYIGWENFAFFDWNHRLSRNRYEIGPWLLYNVTGKSYVADQSLSVLMTLMTPNPYQGHGRLTSPISQKRSILWTKLLQNTNRKPYPVYRIVPLSMTLTGISRLWYFSTVNISEMTWDRAIVTIEHQ